MVRATSKSTLARLLCKTGRWSATAPRRRARPIIIFNDLQEAYMSTDYRSTPAIPFAQLFDGRLEKYGVYETIRSDSTEQIRYLVGRDGVLEAYREENGNSSFARPCFAPIPSAVLDALVEEFEVELVCEHDPRYWGFATEKEWHDWQDQLANEADNHLYERNPSRSSSFAR
jgi:hypothetical protein